MKANSPAAAANAHDLYTLGGLAVVLIALFWRSFLPDYVHFSNDGPLGQQNAAWMQMPAGFTGLWVDVNYLGSSAGTGTPNITGLLHALLSPVACAKFYAPLALLMLGVGAWTFCRQLKLSPLAAMLGALAAMLNSTFFSAACWGVASQAIALGMDFFALALIVGCQSTTSFLIRSTRLALAGLCVGMNVMEAADIGALFSMFVALFAFFHALSESDGTVLRRVIRGVSRIAIVAGFALFIAIQAVLALVGTNISGVAGAAQDAETKVAHWDWATQWSLPKMETFGLLVPGLFGYKMDTPNNMLPAFQDAYRNGVYWGGVGRAPLLDRFFDGGSKGPQPSGPGLFMRFTGGGNYCGILVLVLAGWAIAQCLRRRNGVFPEAQRRMILYWAVVVLFCLPMAWGRFAPWYAVLYRLPYFSTIRNPAKFIIFVNWALVIIFAYGVHALNDRYLDAAAMKAAGLLTQFKNWWAKAGKFDRKWVCLSLELLGASVVGWMIYAAQKPDVIAYLQRVGFGDADPTHENSAPAIAAFSLEQVGLWLGFFALAVGLLLVIVSGYFNGPRAKIGAVLLGGLLVLDLVRANLPWVTHWDYKQKYEVGSLNPILEFLRDKPYEHRVVNLGLNVPHQFIAFQELYNVEWLQHHFPYYNIQSLDLGQRLRLPVDEAAFEGAMAPRASLNLVYLIARRWQLTNTRYLLGPADFQFDILNEPLPPQHQFRIVHRFDITLKPGVAKYTKLEEVTAILNDDGAFALYEFPGALPRAKLYPRWQISTNDTATLQTLASRNFDAWLTVLVSTPLPGAPAANATNDSSSTVEFKSYAPKDLKFEVKASAPSVFLLNDKFDPHWRVTVDGKPAKLLRCNFIMRGVYLPAAGQHTVEFQFSLPNKPFFITLAAIGVLFLLCSVLMISARRNLATVRGGVPSETRGSVRL